MVKPRLPTPLAFNIYHICRLEAHAGPMLMSTKSLAAVGISTHFLYTARISTACRSTMCLFTSSTVNQSSSYFYRAVFLTVIRHRTSLQSRLEKTNHDRVAWTNDLVQYSATCPLRIQTIYILHVHTHTHSPTPT